MPSSVLADLVLVLHGTFVLFVVAGALLVVRWGWVARMHIPCVVWGAWIELTGGVCPLTPVENDLRRRAGEAGYQGGFIEHYVTAALYPDGLTRGMQIALGIGVVVLNVAVYTWILRRRRSRNAEV